ncbi:hypothetical protein D5S18_13455 [Nocardia panacis]|uniref:Antitoxin n=1 Tax=Nocardia panacis TaxID=2340916 RepID=A0A3A4KHX6_9NOCA|nr:type II toxin-antitoxin system VapB family antitoxin [Nocardia panacis]RJO75786.1 hypothetical protein D5S18_13455 [Nocardia panacis]
MSLNIKNERVHALVREAAERTGLSQTSVVEEALKLMLQQLDTRAHTAGASRRERMAEIIADIQPRLTPAVRAALTTEDLYDEAGMPV